MLPSRRLITAGLLLLPTGAFAAQGLSADEQALVDRAVAYLEDLTLARGRFTQTDPRGRRAGGDFYLSRPGKIRFEYDSPNNLLIISDGNQVAIDDGRLGKLERYPLRTTPLAMFLGRNIRLDQGARVQSAQRIEGGFSVTAADGDGRITLTFDDSPMRLREWTVTDAQRQQTRVVLNSLNRVASLDPELFTFDVDRGASRRPG